MLPLENITVGALLRRTAKQYPERDAVLFRGRRLNYRELDRLADDYARALLFRGVNKGDHIALLAEAEPETLALFYAVQRIGAVAVLVNTALAATDLDRVLRLSDPKLLFVGVSYARGRSFGREAEALPPLPTLKEIFAVGGENSGIYAPLDLTKAADDAALQAREREVQPEDTAVIIFTSGSTGVPKAVMTSHFARVNSGIQQAHDFGATADDVICVTVPMFHCFCISANVMAALASGACLCLPDDRHTGSILKAIHDHRCTVMHAVPSMFRAVMGREDFKSWDVSSLRVGLIGGSGYPPEDFIRIEKEFGMTLLSSLGQTEATAGLTVCRLTDSLDKRCHTVGRFMDHVEGKIADLATGAPLPPGQTGEICIRGYLVMQGIYRQEELTKKAIDPEGWLHTGDLAEMDEDGYLIMRGRIKDLIIRGGENISPIEIQDVICTMPQIAYCKIVPVPDAHYGEEACACILLREGQTVEEAAIRSWLRPRVAAYKIPKYMLFFDALPVNATGKVDPLAVTRLARETLGL